MQSPGQSSHAGKNKALIFQPLKNVRRGCWQNFFILKSESVIRGFQRSFRSAELSSSVSGPLSPGWSWKTETRWCPSLSCIHLFIHYLPGHLRRWPGKAGSRILKKRGSVSVFHCCSRIPEVTKEEKWLQGWWFQSMVSWFHGIQAWGQAEISSWKSMVGKSVQRCKRRGRGKRRRRESWDKLPLPFMYLLPPAFKGACLPPQPSPASYSTIL